MPFRSFSISHPRRKRLSRIAFAGAVTLALILATILTISVETSTRFKNIRSGWQEYSQDANPRGIWISEIRGYFGYGGMIHNFKNFVLRKDQRYAQRLNSQTTFLLAAIDSYLQSNPDPVERDALLDIRTVVEQYSANIEIITKSIHIGLNAEQIDAKVRVNDSNALHALEILEQHWRKQRQRSLNSIVSALSDGDALVRSLAGLMVFLTFLLATIAVLIYILIRNVLRSNAAQITELQARKTAQEQERKLAWVVQQSPASILITDTDGKIEFVNHKLLELTGYQESELIGKWPSILKSGHTSSSDYDSIWANLRQGIPWFGVFKNLRKDGSYYWASTSLLPLLNEEGQITNYIGVGEDITEKRRVDEQIAQVQKMEAVGILAGSVAHDFNNVLMTIIGNTELIKLEFEDQDTPEEIDTSLSHIKIASNRARALIQQLLTFARHQPEQTQRIEVNSAIEEALELIRVSTPATIDVTFNSGIDQIGVDIDRTAFFQIIMNLCHNAVEAIGDRGGAITISLDHIQIEDKNNGLRILPDNALGTVKIEIIDDGPGIPQDIQESIFEPFFSTKPVGKGTGLGLSIVKNWVVEAGGQVHLKSSRYKGTRFTLLFPEFVAKEDETQAMARPPTGVEHILLVDDEEELLYVLRRMMARLGYRVEAFSNPSLALHAFRTNPDSYDAVVTDMMMPEMNGTELITNLRTVRANLPAMLISSYLGNKPGSDDLKGVLKVNKPVNMLGLAIALRKTLDTSVS